MGPLIVSAAVLSRPCHSLALLYGHIGVITIWAEVSFIIAVGGIFQKVFDHPLMCWVYLRNQRKGVGLSLK